MIHWRDYPILTESVSTLRATSIDKHDSGSPAFMTDSEIPAVDFDLVKQKYIEDLGLSDVPKSNDALLDIGNGKLAFIEFKNGYIDPKKQFDIRKKIYDSTLIFTDIVSAGISQMRQCVEYILVYNEAANRKNPDTAQKEREVQNSASFDGFARRMGALAGEEYVCFGIKRFEKYCFEKVHTYTEKEFQGYLKAL